MLIFWSFSVDHWLTIDNMLTINNIAILWFLEDKWPFYGWAKTKKNENMRKFLGQKSPSIRAKNNGDVQFSAFLRRSIVSFFLNIDVFFLFFSENFFFLVTSIVRWYHLMINVAKYFNITLLRWRKEVHSRGRRLVTEWQRWLLPLLYDIQNISNFYYCINF